MHIETRDQFLHNLTYTLFRNWRFMAAIFMLVMVLVLLAAYVATPTWSARALLMVTANPAPELPAFTESLRPAAPTPVQSQAEGLVLLLTGKDMAYEMVGTFHLQDLKRQKAEAPRNFREKFKVSLGDIASSPVTLLQKLGLLPTNAVDWVDEAAGDFRDGFFAWLDVSLTEGTEVISLTVRGETPELAENIANTMAKRVEERVVSRAAEANVQAFQAYRSEAKKIEGKLTAAEDAVKQFQAQSNGVSPSDEIRLKASRLEDLRKTVDSLGREKKILEGYLADGASGKTAKGEAVWSQTLVQDDVIRDLKNTLNAREVTLASALNEKTANHPDILNLRSEIGELRKSLQSQIKSVLASLGSNLADVAREIKTVEDDVVALSAKQVTLERLNADVEVYRQLLRTLQSRAEEIEVAARSGMGDITIRVLDKAHVSPLAKPDFPSWPVAAVVGLMLSLFISVGAAFFREYWRDPVKGPSDLEERGIPVLAVVPKYRRKL